MKDKFCNKRGLVFHCVDKFFPLVISVIIKIIKSYEYEIVFSKGGYLTVRNKNTQKKIISWIRMLIYPLQIVLYFIKSFISNIAINFFN